MPSRTETINKIESFANLRPGWRLGAGTPPTRERIDAALALMKMAASVYLDRSNAFVGPDGEILITFYRGDDQMEITIEFDGSMTYACDHGDEQVEYIENIPLANLFTRIWHFQFLAQSYSGSLIRETLIPRKGASQASRSNLHLAITESRSSSATAPKRPQTPDVHTYGNTTKVKPKNPDSIGWCLPKISLSTAR